MLHQDILGISGLPGMPDRVLRGLWKLLHGYRKAFFISFIASAISIVFEIGSQFILRKGIDDITQNKVTVSIVALAGLYVLFALAKGAFLFLKGQSSAKASEGTTKKLRDMLFDHIQKLRFQYHDKMKTGELIQRSTNDVESIRNFYGDQVPEIARIVMMFVFNFLAILTMQWKLALLSIIIAPIIIVVSSVFFGRIERAFGKYQKQDGIVSSVIQENLSGVRIVRAFARQEYENEKFDAENEKKFTLGTWFLINHTVYWPVSHLLCAAQLIFGIAVSGFMAMDGTISIGTFVAYMGMVSSLIWPLQHLGRMVAQLSTVFVSYGRIREILNVETEDLSSGIDTGIISGNIEVKDLHFEYEHNAPVLKDVSFSAVKGEVIALLGGAGSGKSTMVNLLPRFYDYAKGQILLDGIELKKYSRHFLRSNIGIVEQEPFLFSASIRENICYGVHREASDQEVENAARAASIHESIMGFPEQYNTIVGERGVTLSGGQKQRIAIARTILKDPKILILDDSTSAVDAETEENIRDCLASLMRGRTTFIIAHRIQSLMDADRILVFKDGSIAQSGTHETLIAKSGFYKKVFELQTKIEEELDKEIGNE